jgi:ubiquinone/menaquinone biosynthesis C-methylase UbiE
MVKVKNSLAVEILENPLLILESENILNVIKKHWITNHANLTQPEEFVAEFFAWLKIVDTQKGRAIFTAEIKKYYKKKLKKYWNANLPIEKPSDMFLELMQSELAGVKTVLDFGCGKLAFLKNMAENNNHITRLTGIDPKSQPDLLALDPRIEFARSLDAVSDASVDLAIIKLVLHHLRDDQEAQNIFKELRRVLRPNGKIIVFEESFSSVSCDAHELASYLAKFNLEMSPVTSDFLQLAETEKIEFLFLNDWLMNLQNPYMPWTGLYKSMEDWITLIESGDFKKESAQFLGAIKHRKRKQGMTVMLNFFK